MNTVRMLIDKFKNGCASLFEADTTAKAIVMFLIACVCIALLVWYFMFSGLAVEAEPIYQGF